jgi:hypothetical protein
MPKWWDDLDPSGGGNALRYYLGPAYEPIQQGTNFLASLSPGADMMDMHDESAQLMQSRGGWDAVNHLGGLAAATMGMAIPGTAKGVSEGVDEAAGMVRGYHTSNRGITDFDPNFQGTTFFAASPQASQSGASAGANHFAIRPAGHATCGGHSG